VWNQEEELMKNIYCIIALISIAYLPVFSLNYYVSPPGAPNNSEGNDSNDGLSSDSPFATIAHANSLTNPGDTVFLMDGTYNETVTVYRSGSADNYIAYKAINQWQAKFETNTSGNGFGIDANYIEVNGIELTNPGGHGINGENNHHIRVLNNHVYGCGNSGFSGGFSDFYHVEGNLIHHNAQLSWYSGISIYEATDIGESYEGYRIVIRNNISHSNFQIYGGPYTDGNGIIIDDWNFTQNQGTPYTHGALVENNLTYNNGGAGIKVVWSDNILIRNNTVYKNNTDNKDVGTYKGNIFLGQARGCTLVNNISWADPNINSNNAALMDRGAPSANITRENIWANNLLYNDSPQADAIDIGDGSNPTLINNITGQQPLFVNADTSASANFRLTSLSPARDVGTNSYGLPAEDLASQNRIYGDGVDIGAYEFIDGGVKTFNLASTKEHPIILVHDRTLQWKGSNLAEHNQQLVPIRLFNAQGQELHLNWQGNHADLSSLSSGSYMLQTPTGNKPLHLH